MIPVLLFLLLLIGNPCFSQETTSVHVVRDNKGFYPIRFVTFPENLVQLSSDFIKAGLFQEGYKISEGLVYVINPDEDDPNAALKKRFQSLNIDLKNGAGNGYFFKLDNTPLLFWMIGDYWYLIDSRKPCQAFLINAGTPNDIPLVYGKKIGNDDYKVFVDEQGERGVNYTSWEVDLKNKQFKFLESGSETEDDDDQTVIGGAVQ